MNTELILILGLTLFNTNGSESKELHIVKNYISSMEIDPLYTQKKINIAQKITPLLPSKYIKTVDQSILYALSIVKVLEIKNIFKNTKDTENTSVLIKDDRDRLNKIMSILKEETLKTDFTNMGAIINILANFDKYKNLLNVFIKLNNDKTEIKDSKDLMEIAQTLLGDKTDDKDAKEMKKMLQIINLLNSNKKDTKEQAANND